MPAPRWFGRARHASFREKAKDVVLGMLFSGGWTAAITHAIGLQGTLEIAEHIFRVRRFRGAPSKLRIVFVSDFHAGPTVHASLFAETFAAIEEARGDLLLLGGDYVSFHAKYVMELVEPLRRIETPLGKYGVLGNHDLMGDDAYITARLRDAGVRILVNENVRLPAPHDDVWICGLDDWNEGQPDAKAAFHGATGTRVLLAHQPDALSVLAGERFDLGLFGHVHGGQFLLRNRRPVISHRGPISRLYMHGGVFHAGVNDAPVLVSRGIGTSTLPVRRHANPQVHVCTLVARDS